MSQKDYTIYTELFYDIKICVIKIVKKFDNIWGVTV